MKYYSVLIKKDIFTHVTTCMNSDNIMLSKINHLVTKEQILYDYIPI